MTCVRIANGALPDTYLCLSDATEHMVIVNGQPVRFEFDARFGPFVLTKAGRIATAQPGARHPFWRAFAEWHAAHGGPPVEKPRKALHVAGSLWVDEGSIGSLPAGVRLCPGCPRCASSRGEGAP